MPATNGRVSASIDFESRSVVDLKKSGLYVYAAHPDTEFWCMAWALGDAEPQVWVPGQAFPARLAEHIATGGEMRAWNAQFERVMWREIGVPRHGFPPVPAEQWVCTAAEAGAMSLPRSLGESAKVLRMDLAKDNDGHNLMMRMARPRKTMDDGTPIWWDDPVRLARLIAYCQQDVRVERALAGKLRRLSPAERRVYLLDQAINDRGVYLDRELIDAAERIAAEAAEDASETLMAVTGGAVRGVTKPADLKAFLASRGVLTDSVDKAHVATLLEGKLPEDVRKALQLRADAGRSSTAKLSRMRAMMSADDRVRGSYLYHGAGTGRWSGKGVQAHNLPRGDVPGVLQLLPAVLAGDLPLIDAVAPPLAVVSSLLRSVFRAAPGHTLVAADYSAIEARVLNWIAGEEEVLERFRAYDAGDKDKDPYKVMASLMFAKSVGEIDKDERQTGKAAELGCGFQMGPPKFVEAAWKVYQVRVTPEQAEHAVGLYRSTHPNVRELWNAANRAVLRAVREPGTVETFNGIRATVKGGALWLVLPSGRPLCYPGARIVQRPVPWDEETTRDAVQVMSVNSMTKRWEARTLYGGLIVENIVQAVARDVIAEAMLRLDAAGWRVVMHTHDEIVCEVPSPPSDELVAEMVAQMLTLPAWAEGLPLSAEGWSDVRYRK